MAENTPPATVYQNTLVSAIRYRSPFLVVGIGSSIQVWRDDVSNFSQLTSYSLSKALNVNAIEFENKDEQLKISSKACHHLLLTHRYHFTYCSFHYDLLKDHCNVEEHYSYNCTHMIMCCTAIDGIAYLLTDKNDVILFNLTLGKHEERTKCPLPSRCNLTSGHFISVTPERLLIASGTANKVLISKVKFDSNGGCKSSQLQELLGHAGWVYSIDYHAEEGILISASDDRTIRTWKSFNLKKEKFEFLHTYYGHKARIWKVASMTRASLPIVASVGEDSHLFLWDLRAPFTKRLDISLNSNNSLWSLEASPSRVICGGNDSSVYAISISYLFCEDLFNRYTNCTKNKELPSMPKLLMYQKVMRDNVLDLGLSCVTYSTELYIIDPISDPSDRKNVCQPFEWFGQTIDPKEIVAYKINPDQKYMGFGYADGQVALICRLPCNKMNVSYLKVFEKSVIAEIIFVSPNQFLVCTKRGKIRLVEVLSNGKSLKLSEDVPEITLPLKRRAQAQAALIYEDLLFVGCHSSHLFVYKIPLFKAVKNPEPIHAWNIHDNGVTSIQRHPQFPLVYSSGKNGTIEEYLVQSTQPKVVRLRTFVHLSNLKSISGFYFDQYEIRFIYGFTGSKFLLWDLKKKTTLFEEECGGEHRPFDIVIGPESNGDYQIDFGYIKHSQVICIRQRIPGDEAFQKMGPSLMPLKVNKAVPLLDEPFFDYSYFLLLGEVNYLQLWSFDKKKKHYDLTMTLYGHLSSVAAAKVAKVDEKGKLWQYAITVGSRSQLVVWRFSFLHDTIVSEERVNRNSKQNEPDGGNDLRFFDIDCFWTIADNIEFFMIVACSDQSFRVFKLVDCFGYGAPSKLDEMKRVNVDNSSVLRVRFLDCGRMAAVGSTDGFLRFWFFTYDTEKNTVGEENNYLLNNNESSNSDFEDDDGVLESTPCSFNVPSKNESKERRKAEQKLKERERLEKRYGHFKRWDKMIRKTSGKTLSHCDEITKFHLHQAGINAFDFLHSPPSLLVATGGDDSTVRLTFLELDSAKKMVNLAWTIHRDGVHTCQITDLKFYKGTHIHSVGIDQVFVDWKIVPKKVGEAWELDPVNLHNLSVTDVSSMFIQSIRDDDNSFYMIIAGEGIEMVKCYSSRSHNYIL